jgi:glycosyltransferase involved in cell wall biosynthesis
LKILWMSDSPTTPSGFGNVTRFVCSGLADRGDDVSIIGWQARGRPESWAGCTLYPTRFDTFGADVLLGYLQRHTPDVLVTLADVWWLTYITNPAITGFMRSAGIPWALYFPIDGDLGEGALPPSWVRILERVDIPIAMSEFGRDTCRANGIDPGYIPHGVDTSLFRPPADRVKAKRALGYEGRFVVLCDARNQPRKLLPRVLDIFARFAADKPDALLHLHTDPHDPAARTAEYCYELTEDVAMLGLADRVRFTDGMSIEAGVPIERLVGIYQAADVHLLASWGEGFGLPSLQAAAAGVVPMAGNHTASRELVTDHGEAIAIRSWVPDQFGIRRALIDVDDAVARLERLCARPDVLADKSAASRRFAEAYDWGRVLPQWVELLDRQVPLARQRMDRVPASIYTIGPIERGAAAGTRSAWPLGRLLAEAVDVPDGASVTVKVVESQAGQLAAEVMRDASAAQPDGLTIPVTLAVGDPELIRVRVPGAIHVASSVDGPVVWALAKVFPGITVWSSAPIDLGASPFTGESVRPAFVKPGSEAFRRHLAASVLALDLGGAVPDLPTVCAELGVPSIGLRTTAGQQDLWSDLSLAATDVATAARLARRVMTDHAHAAELVADARDRVAERARGAPAGAIA